MTETRKPHALKFTDSEQGVIVTDVSFSERSTETGEVLREFDSYEEKEAYMEPVCVQKTHRFDLQGADDTLRIVRVQKSTAEENAEQVKILEAENLKKQQEIQTLCTEALLDCVADNLVFSEAYPELATQRQALRSEIAANLELISTLRQ